MPRQGRWPKNVKPVTSKNGQMYLYYDNRADYRVRLHGVPYSDEWWRAYYAAADGSTPAEPESRAARGSFNEAVNSYYASPEYRAGAKATQSYQSRELERIRKTVGGLILKNMQPHHVERMRNTRVEEARTKGYDGREAGNNLVKALKAVCKHALKVGLLAVDPTVSVKKLTTKSDGHHTWTDAEVEQYEAHWPLGSTPRLALALLKYTGCRRGDVVRLGWQHIKRRDTTWWISFVQNKTGGVVSLPVHDDLAAALQHAPTNNLTFLMTDQRPPKPFTDKGIGGRFRGWCDDAGLPARCTMHGLRKYLATRLADSGATEHQIAAVTGHQSIAEVQRYTKKANRSGLAAGALERLQPRKPK